MDLFKMCLHLNQGLNQEYELVCYQCGLILGPSFSFFNLNEDKSSLDHCKAYHEIKTYLWDCCDRMHIPEAVTTSILMEFNSFR